MNETKKTTPAATIKCFTPNDNCIAVEFLDGKIQGWPLHCLAGWTFKPLTLSKEEDASKKMDFIEFDFGMWKAHLHGYRLIHVVKALKAGQGCECIEKGERHEAASVKDEPYIVKASAKLDMLVPV